MKTTTWTAFKRAPIAVFRGDKRIRVNRNDGTWFIVTRYSDIKNDEDFARPASGVKDKTRCDLCGHLQHSIFTVPFDLSFPPGYYCKKCRDERDIMDVEKARKYGKIF